MKSVLFVGDINVDLILGGLESLPAVDREVACSSFSVTMGSSTVITAANYAGLGGKASVAGLTGRDQYGDLMIDGMRKRGIDTALVQTTDSVRTGVTVNLIYEKTRTQITYPGTIAAFHDITQIEQNIGRFDHVHFSGIYQQHAFRPKLTGLLETVRRSGATVSLDPQWDPSERWERLEEWLPDLDYLFVNEDEALSITQTTDSSAAIAHLSRRTKCPVCKLGAKGALIAPDGRVIHIPPFEITVRDSTGAGDAFAAGVLYVRLERGEELREAVRFGNGAGARNCTMEGGINACPSYRQITHFMENCSE